MSWSWDCEHPECQDYGFCQKDPVTTTSAASATTHTPTYSVKEWFRDHPDPDADHEPADPQPQQEDSDVIEKIPESTHQDDALDTLVSRASIPNLGALIKQGIKQGLIAPTATYR